MPALLLHPQGIMTRTIQRWAAPVTAFLFLSVTHQAWGQEDWTWRDRDHKNRARAELDRILGEHTLFVKSNGAQGRRADLVGADLKGVDLIGAELTGADLQSANLKNGDLTEARLSRANLGDVNLICAKL